MDKSPDAFRTISEVAEDLDLPQHVLRFWESRFSQIKPLKRGGGRRYYRPEDVELLRGIRHLLYSEGYTIKGVQRILRDQGLRKVAAIGRAALNPLAMSSEEPIDRAPERAAEPPPAPGPIFYAPPAERRAAEMRMRTEHPPEEAEPLDEHEGADAPALRAAEPVAAPVAPPPSRPGPLRVVSAAVQAAMVARGEPSAPRAAPPVQTRQEPTFDTSAPEADDRPEDDEEEDGAAEPVAAEPEPSPEVMIEPEPEPVPPGAGERIEPTLLPAARAAPEGAAPRGPLRPPPVRPQDLSPDVMRRLQATLFELTECKRLLDEVR